MLRVLQKTLVAPAVRSGFFRAFSASSSSEVEATIRKLAQKRTGTPIESTTLLNDLDSLESGKKWDQLDNIEFLLDVEEAFHIVVPDNVADNITSINEIVDYVVKNSKQ